MDKNYKNKLQQGEIRHSYGRYIRGDKQLVFTVDKPSHKPPWVVAMGGLLLVLIIGFSQNNPYKNDVWLTLGIFLLLPALVFAAYLAFWAYSRYWFLVENGKIFYKIKKPFLPEQRAEIDLEQVAQIQKVIYNGDENRSELRLLNPKGETLEIFGNKNNINSVAYRMDRDLIHALSGYLSVLLKIKPETIHENLNGSD